MFVSTTRNTLASPGDAHSRQEWVWRRREHLRLFADARDDQVRGESTPFYLWSRGAHHRIGESLPDVRVIAVIRDPVDRAYSSWMHLWSDGLEPESDFETAFALQDRRAAAGWAPFWRYRDLGRYGEQLTHLRRYVDPARTLVLRYRDIIDEPQATVDRACRLLDIDEGHVPVIPPDNSRSFVEPGWRPALLGPVVRAGDCLGAYAPPQVWRAASAPLIGQLSGRREVHRPHLTPGQRERLLPSFLEDIHRLAALTGQDLDDWLSSESRGSFAQRQPGRSGFGFGFGFDELSARR